ncbi:MAG: NUDIX domain-containing protein [Actinomycetota bacterium]|nr:NUDIX domain-containing protein [Actinomycetota bacterium]
MVKRIEAAGAVLWRASGGVPEVAVVHRPHYDDWSLPKGKLDAGESVYAAAVREVAEETGFAAVLGRHLGQVVYEVAGIPKTVDYFAARVAGGSFAPNSEVDSLVWLPVEQAAELVSYQHDRGVLARFASAPADLVTVLLVRHAHAGKRSGWDGPDDARPLSRTGRAEVSALTGLLPLFGPSRVHAAPKVRCVDTVRPVADLLGVAVSEEPALAERDDPDAASARLREIVALGGVSVVCSQGGVIPDLVTASAARSAMELGEIRSRKGSVWVLSFHDGELMAAHYIRRPRFD